MNKNFLIICTGYFGDVLLTSKLTRDIKKNYPDSKVVYICDSPYVSVAQNLPGVDKVVSYNREHDSNIFNYLSFIIKFPYRNKIFHTFIIHQNKKSRVILARLLGTKKITTWESFKSDNRHKEIIENNPEMTKIAYFNANLLSVLTNKKTDDEDIEFIVPEYAQQNIDKFLAENNCKNLVAINPQAGDSGKSWNVSEFLILVKNLISQNITPVITGVSKDGNSFINALIHDNEIKSSDYINMIDKTTFCELGALYKRCLYIISIDTGSAHMACSVGAKTVVLFFRKNASMWGPINTNQNSCIYNQNITAEDVLEKINLYPSISLS